MGVPKKHKTQSRTRSRRAHHALSTVKTSKCANCGARVLPHQICQDCGYYRGRQVVTPKVAAKKSKR